MLVCGTEEALTPGRSTDKPPASTAPRPLPSAAAGTCAQTGAARALPCRGHLPHAQPGKVLRAKGSWLCRSQQRSRFAWQHSSFRERTVNPTAAREGPGVPHVCLSPAGNTDSVC